MMCTTSFPPLITWVEHGTMGGVEHVGKMVCTTSFPPLITLVEHGTMGGITRGKNGVISTTYYKGKTRNNGRCRTRGKNGVDHHTI